MRDGEQHKLPMSELTDPTSNPLQGHDTLAPERVNELTSHSALLAGTLDNMDQGLLAFDANDVIQVYNRRVLELMDLPRELLAAKPTYMRIREYQAQTGEFGSDAEYRRSLAETGLRVNHQPYEHVRPNGIVVEVRTVRLSDGGAIRTYTDITERKRQEQALRDREHELTTQNHRFEAALENMTEGLCMVDAEQRLIVCNSKFAQMYRLPEYLAKARTPLHRIIKCRIRAATAPRDLERHTSKPDDAAHGQRRFELQDGRTIRVNYQPMVGGGWVETHEDITNAVQAQAQIAHMALHDALTNLPNRVMYREKLEDVLRMASADDLFAILCMDLDNFKGVNDTLGQPIGDALLREVTERLRFCVGESNLVARLGGDEFAVIQTGGPQPESSTTLAQRIIEAIGRPYHLEGHQVVIGTSIGIAIAPSDGSNPDQLLKCADMALYRAKNDGRRTYRFFEIGMDARMQARRMLELDLRAGFAQGQFEIFYQPVIDVSSNEISSFEGLLRWRHPDRGLLSPSEFLALAEETGLIVPLGGWVLRQACLEAVKWPSEIRVAVNVSPVQFASRSLILTVVSALGSSGLAPNRLELEITESALLHDNDATLATLHQLRDLGIRISMDDFGTGYSSLNYLRSFPFDKIKIDRSFIRGLSDNGDCAAIVRAVTELSKSLGMSTTAEGVETADQLDRLRAQGCTEAQGYLFSAPIPAREVGSLLRRSELRKHSAA
jgi:diguanylate cyclase (GGDEF)-like protein